MYEVTTAIKTLTTTDNLEVAMAIAEGASRTFSYVEVKQIITIAPWYAESVKIFR